MALTGIRGIVQPGGANNPMFEQYVAVAYTSGGASDAGKIPILNAEGKLDASIIPVALAGPLVVTETDVDCGKF